MNSEVAVVQAAVPATAPAITPMEMLNIAVQQGADLDKLSKLMDLQERWEKNEARKAFVTALATFKANAPKIVKDKQVSFGQGKTAYKHATLDKASEAIGEELSRHGLSHRWDVKQDGGHITVTCILTHTQGHSESVSMTAQPDTSGSKNSIQAIGSTTSYLQRYTLFAACGIAPKDADDDGTGGKKEMPESQRADFIAAIDALTNKDEAKALWQSITTATTAIGDVETHDHLRTLMAAKQRNFTKGQ